MDLFFSAWLCICVHCEKSVVLSSFFFKAGGTVHKKGPNINDVHGGFGPPFSIQLFLGKNKIRCLEHKEKGCTITHKDQSYRTTLYAGPGPSFYMYDHLHREE